MLSRGRRPAQPSLRGLRASRWLGAGPPAWPIECGRAVAKVAHHLAGLAWNLQEAAAWLSFPHDFRKHLAPCVALTPELVLIQERVTVVGPPLLDPIPDDAWLAGRDEARRAFADRIYACREQL